MKVTAEGIFPCDRGFIPWKNSLPYFLNEVTEVLCSIDELIKGVAQIKGTLPFPISRRAIKSVLNQFLLKANVSYGQIPTIKVAWDCHSTSSYFTLELRASGWNGKENIALEFCDPANYLGAQIEIDTKVNLLRILTKNIGSDIIEDNLGRRDPSLSELIWAILDDVTFFPSPKKRQEFSEKLERQIQAIEEGKEELISFDDFEDKLKTKLKLTKENNNDVH